MKALRLFCVLIAAMVAVPLSSVAAEPKPTTTAYGNALDVIDWGDSITKDGLRIVVGERAIPASTLPIFVQNVGTETLRGVRLRVVWEEGDDKVVDNEAWVYPLELKPGEVGIAGSRPQVRSFPTDYGTFHFYPLTSSDSNLDSYVDLDVLSGVLSASQNFQGVIKNNSGHDVEDLWVYWACVEKSGIPSAYGYEILEVRVLRDGDTEEFESNMVETCEDGLLVTAMATIRD